jgi:hypothetical protein
MLRFVIAIIATLELAYFYTDLPFPLAKMIDLNARWFNILLGLYMAVFAPLLAVAALALAAMGRRLGVAAILLAVAGLLVAVHRVFHRHHDLRVLSERAASAASDD